MSHFKRSILLKVILVLVVSVSAYGQGSTSTYVFLTDESTVVQTGGFAGVYETYPIQGKFQLTVDAAMASFTVVDSNLLNPAGFLPTQDLGELFNMTELQGTVVDETLIEFRGKTADGTDTDISLKIVFDNGSVRLTGQTIPPPNSADFFIFNLDAVARMKYSGGTGEPNNPYQIATAADLILLGETPEDYDKHFVMTADIDLDPNLPGGRVFDRAVIAPIDDTENWFQYPWFNGVFDGKGHTISNLRIRGEGHLGLFGCLGADATISNIGLEAVDVNGAGNYEVGSLAGTNWGGELSQAKAAE